MTPVLNYNCDQRDAVEAYSTAFDEAWAAVEDAIAKVGKLNDCLYQGEALVARAPLADVVLMRHKARELKAELDSYEGAREPVNMSPILPGEIAYQQLLRDAQLR